MTISKFLKVFFIVSTITLIFISCKQDVEIETIVEEIEEEEEGADDPAEFSASLNDFKGDNIIIGALLVKVVGELGAPIEGAEVATGNYNGQTNFRGIVVFENVNANENLLVAKISKLGYISTAKTILAASESSQIIEVVLLKPDIVSLVNSGEEASVATPSGAMVKLNGNYFNADGSSYSGLVNVSVKHLSPSEESTYTTMPGALIAQNTSGQIKVLETYGMLAVNLTTISGEPLNINAENKSTIIMPIDISQSASSKADIPLWYFDEDKGIWVEEGSAVKEGSNYVGEVSHFSWWNCDLPLNLVGLCLTIQNSDENILQNQQIEIKRQLTGQIIYKGLSNWEGKLCGPIPKNEEIVVSVYTDSNCLGTNILFQEIYGKYNDQFNFIDIVIPSYDTVIDYSISGNISECGKGIIKNGIVEIKHQENIHLAFTDANGNFSYNLQGCKDDTVDLTAYDIRNENKTQTQTLSFVNNEAVVNNLETCDNYTEKVYVGDLIFENQFEVDEFGKLLYNRIDGSITIKGYEIETLEPLKSITTIEGDLNFTSSLSSNSVENLEGFSNLKIIKGKLRFSGNRLLTNLSGLEYLTEIGGLQLYQANITTLEHLVNLKNINGDLKITHSDKLQDLKGLEGLEYLKGKLILEQNDILKDVSGLDNLKVIDEDLNIILNKSLLSLDGLHNLNQVNGSFVFERNGVSTQLDYKNLTSLRYIGGDFEISYKRELTTLEGLENLIEVGGNFSIIDGDQLANIKNLKSLTTVGGDFQIYGNDLLENCEGLENLTTVKGDLVISTNYLLLNLKGLNKLEKVEGSLKLTNNLILNSIESLNTLTNVGGDLSISGSNPLASLNGLDNLNAIGRSLNVYRNEALVNLKGLEKLTSALNVYIHSNNALNSLEGLENLSVLRGGVDISSNFSLNDLKALKNINEVNGNLNITFNRNLKSLEGLNNITKVENRLIIDQNWVLNDITALKKIESIGDNLEIDNNDELLNLNGLEGVTSIGGHLEIDNNERLNSISGLSNLNQIEQTLFIQSNPQLSSLSGLEKVITVYDLIIQDNDALINLEGLNNLQTIKGFIHIKDNENLNSLNGLENMREFKGFQTGNAHGLSNLDRYFSIIRNPSLTDFCALSNSNVSIFRPEKFGLGGNAYNPTQSQILSATECKP